MTPSESDPIRLLLVEDNLGDARLIREDLRSVAGFHFDMVHVERLDAAIERLRSQESSFDVMLLDLTLPDSSGLDTVSLAQSKAPYIPIVVFTGADEGLGMDALRRGAQDYLIKGKSDGQTVARAIRYATERKRLEVELRQANDLLDLRVRQRTAELENAITVLGEEVSDRTDTERDLRESEERLRQMVEAMSEVIWIASPDLGTVFYANGAYEKVWGRPCDSLYSDARSWILAVHPDDRDGLIGVMRKLVAEPASQQPLQFRVVRPDGAVVPVSGRTFGVCDDRGALVRICGMVGAASVPPAGGTYIPSPVAVGQKTLL